MRKFTQSLIAIIISLIFGALILWLMGKDPVSAYMDLLRGSGLMEKVRYSGRQNMFTDFMSFIDAMTPMIFASLAVALALKGGFFNIGVSGQMLFAGFCAHMAAMILPSKIAVVIVGFVAGALIGALIGWLKYRFNVNEVVSSIMINSILMYMITFYINTFYINPVSRQSKSIISAARLTLSGFRWEGLKVDIALAFPVAIITALFLHWFIERTTYGYEIKASGLSPNAAYYAGMNVNRTALMTMTLSGALAGLAGVSYFCGYLAAIQPGVVPSMGFDAIAVSLLGGNDPLGCVLASFLITVISKGSVYMSSRQNIDMEIASLVTAFILTFAACSSILGRRRK
ncbi:MAG: ABC transporter permease [Synergistaceae bacterium]|nr:ABC transporter permease [Synergistaceae bacterium]